MNNHIRKFDELDADNISEGKKRKNMPILDGSIDLMVSYNFTNKTFYINDYNHSNAPYWNELTEEWETLPEELEDEADLIISLLEIKLKEFSNALNAIMSDN